jgi:hypothetical protein
VVAEQVAGAGQAVAHGARGHRQEPLHPLLDVRRAGALPVGRRGRALLLRAGHRDQQQGATGDADGTAGPLGSRRPASSITSSTTNRCQALRDCRWTC